MVSLASGEEVGDEDAIDETSVKVVSREVCDVDEVSDSSAELREEPDDTEKDALRWARTSETSGALYDSIFVVDRRATGDDIVRISTGLSENRIVADRVGDGGMEVVSSRFRRSVKALAIDIISTCGGR